MKKVLMSLLSIGALLPMLQADDNKIPICPDDGSVHIKDNFYQCFSVKGEKNLSADLIEKTVYNAKCESKKVQMTKEQHGWLDKENNYIWLEDGYMVENHSMRVRKCDANDLCIKCKKES